MSKDWLARNEDNGSKWSNMSTHGLLFQWSSTIKIQLSVLVYYKTNIIITIISLNGKQFSPWCGWQIAHLAINNNHSPSHLCLSVEKTEVPGKQHLHLLQDTDKLYHIKLYWVFFLHTCGNETYNWLITNVDPPCNHSHIHMYIYTMYAFYISYLYWNILHISQRLHRN